MKKHFTSSNNTILIVAALCCMGYVASLFLTYSFIVMPGLSIIDDRSFVAAFQGLESRFAFEPSGYSNIPAMIAFPGSLILTLIAALVHRRHRSGKWILASLLLFIIGMISTFMVNLPANEFIYNAGHPDTLNVEQIRAEFNESRWSTWNHFRSFTTTIGVLCLIRAITLKYPITANP